MTRFEILSLVTLFTVALALAVAGGGGKDYLEIAKEQCFEGRNLAACDYWEEHR